MNDRFRVAPGFVTAVLAVLCFSSILEARPHRPSQIPNGLINSCSNCSGAALLLDGAVGDEINGNATPTLASDGATSIELFLDSVQTPLLGAEVSVEGATVVAFRSPLSPLGASEDVAVAGPLAAVSLDAEGYLGVIDLIADDASGSLISFTVTIADNVGQSLDTFSGSVQALPQQDGGGGGDDEVTSIVIEGEPGYIDGSLDSPLPTVSFGELITDQIAGGGDNVDAFIFELGSATEVEIVVASDPAGLLDPILFLVAASSRNDLLEFGTADMLGLTDETAFGETEVLTITLDAGSWAVVVGAFDEDGGGYTLTVNGVATSGGEDGDDGTAGGGTVDLPTGEVGPVGLDLDPAPGNQGMVQTASIPAAGDQVTVDLFISEGADGSVGFSTRVLFDPAALSVVSTVPGNIYDGSVEIVAETGDGEYVSTYSFFPPFSASGDSGSLLQITFEVLVDFTGLTTVRLDVLSLADANLASTDLVAGPGAAFVVIGGDPPTDGGDGTGDGSGGQTVALPMGAAGPAGLDLDAANGDQGKRQTDGNPAAGDQVTVDLFVTEGALGQTGYQATLTGTRQPFHSFLTQQRTCSGPV